MTLHRISLKFYVEDPHTIDLSKLIPVFHRWIQNDSVDGLLIDVADYKHVQHGPGVVLIAHECDYSLDMGDGRAGLCYLQKRDTGQGLRDRLWNVFHSLLSACCTLQQEPEFAGKVRFRTDEALLSIFDRLRAPNTPETVTAVSSDLEAVVGEIFTGSQVKLERANQDPRDCCAIRIKASTSPPLATLIDRVRENLPTAG